MTKVALRLKLKPNGSTPIYRQIEGAIRAAIDSRQLATGDRLPSVADLAKQIGVNKLTAVKAFQQLERAGLIRSEVGRGTFVASRGEGPPGPGPAADARPDVARSMRRLREGYARGLREMMAMERPPGTINLSGGVPSSATIPDGSLERLTEEALRANPRRLYEYAGPAGLPELREALCATLSHRGVTVTPDEIIVTNGSQQGVTLAAAWAHDDGRATICETPTFTGVPGAMTLFGHWVQSVPWHDGAPNLAELRALSESQRALFYVCPDFHNPTGLTVPTEARREIADWARRSDSCVLVDEIFRELRFEGDEPPSLYSLLAPGHRILVGSISKTFMPGLRIGYLVADRPLVSELLAYKRYMDVSGPSLTHAIAAQFLKSAYAKHLERMRTYYRSRRDAAVKALEEFMPAGVHWTRPQGGFQLWVMMPAGASSIQLFLQGIEQGVAIVPGPAHDIDGRYLNCFRLGYGHCSPEEIRTGVRRLGSIINALVARGVESAEPSGPGILV